MDFISNEKLLNSNEEEIKEYKQSEILMKNMADSVHPGIKVI